MKINKISFIIIAITILSGCTNKFDELIHDPSAVNQSSPGSFLNSIIIDGVNTGLSRCFTLNNELSQVTVSLSEVSSARVHRYIIAPSESYLWNNYYLILTDADNMYQKAVEYNDANYKAIAITLKVWLFQNLTDIYGDIPYTQALRGYSDYLLQPKFDSQQSIYIDLIKKLDEANALYDKTKALTYGTDILYNADHTTNFANNITKWKKFTNSLRLRVLMRVEGKYSKAPQLIREMLANSTKYPLMTSLEDGATLKYTGVTPLLNPFSNYTANDFRGTKAMSQFFISKLNSWNDPRLKTWASTSTTSGTSYVGIPAGYSELEADVVTGRASSRLNEALKNSSVLGSIMQYAEVEFLLAEAALRGYSSDSAEDHYKKGVTASLTYWGSIVPTDFFTRVGIQFDGTLDRIMTQKYFALFFTDMQQWIELRRTGYPVLPKGDGMENNKELPSRLKYPLSLQSLNLDNYNAAIAKMGGDEINVKVWWQQ